MKYFKFLSMLFVICMLSFNINAGGIKVENLPAETTPAAGDEIWMTDISASNDTNKITLTNFFVTVPVAITSSSVITGATVEATGDTSSGDNSAMGYTATEGLVLTGQGSNNDITIKNDADADILIVLTGSTNVDIVGDTTAATFAPDGDTSSDDSAAIGYTASEGIIITGQGSTNDVTIKNDADAIVAAIQTGTTDFDIVGIGTAATFEPDGDTSAGDNSAIGYTAAEGIVITGQGSTYDVVVKNDADGIVMSILTGGTGVVFAGTTDVSSGTVTGPSGTWDSGGIDIATSDTYAIAGADVIDNATTFSSGMVTSSLTTVGALASGSIATGFGNIATGGTVTIGVDDTGADVKFFGASAGAFILYDESADTLDVRGASAAAPGVIKITTGELTNVDGGILGRVEFQAPLDAGGTDAILVAASIWAEADDTFAADNNTADLVFATAVSETAAEKMRLTSAGELSLVSGTLTLSDGATVTQLTDKSTGVTISNYSGQITTDNDTLAAGAEVTFIVTNTVVTALDVVCISIASSPDGDSEVIAYVNRVASGAFDIVLSNLSGNADTGAIVINFVVLRGASS